MLSELHRACLLSDVEGVASSLRRRHPTEVVDTRGRTPLMLACRTGNFEIAKLLVEAGANVSATNNNGTTPLMYAKTAAVGSGDLQILELLLTAGADINARDSKSKTAFIYLTEHAATVTDFFRLHGAIS